MLGWAFLQEYIRGNSLTDVLVPVGSTRTVEFSADNLGDWAFHCHMLHYAMNQMGHGQPNMVGVKLGELDHNVRKFLPGYMTMGQDGMANMGDMVMRIPPNSVPLVGARGPWGYITMGGLYTNLKVREELGDLKAEEAQDFNYGGGFKMPAGTQAVSANEAEMKSVYTM